MQTQLNFHSNNSTFEGNPNLPAWQEALAGKLITWGVSKDNYSKEKAMEVIEICVGYNFLKQLLEYDENKIISLLN